MTDRPENTPAFPFAAQGPDNRHLEASGMLLRDYFAGQALAGMLADGQGPNTHWLNGGLHNIAEHAYAVADAMLSERIRP